MPDDSQTSTTKAQTAPPPDAPEKAESPTALDAHSLRYTFTRAFREFRDDQGTDVAATLTYYSVMALFPALVAVVALLGVFGQGESTVQAMLDFVRGIGPGQGADTLEEPIRQIVSSERAGVALALGLASALWSASAYVGAFGRAMNRVYEVDEGRPFWKLRPQQLLLTLVCLVLAAAVLLALVVTGPVARSAGDVLGLGDSVVDVWNVAKWPFVVLAVIALVALLYYATPNVQQPKMRWLSLGAAVAIGMWVVASLLFGVYVANFGSYNRTYGSLAGVVVFLLWLWITNVSLLFGAQVDAELERVRQLDAGIPAEETLQLPPRDTTASVKAQEAYARTVAEARRIRLAAEDAPPAPPPDAAG